MSLFKIFNIIISIMANNTNNTDNTDTNTTDNTDNNTLDEIDQHDNPPKYYRAKQSHFALSGIGPVSEFICKMTFDDIEKYMTEERLTEYYDFIFNTTDLNAIRKKHDEILVMANTIIKQYHEWRVARQFRNNFGRYSSLFDNKFIRLINEGWKRIENIVIKEAIPNRYVYYYYEDNVQKID